MNEHRSGDTENTSEYTYISVSNISRSDQGARIKSSNKTLTRYSVFENKGNAQKPQMPDKPLSSFKEKTQNTNEESIGDERHKEEAKVMLTTSLETHLRGVPMATQKMGDSNSSYQYMSKNVSESKDKLLNNSFGSKTPNKMIEQKRIMFKHARTASRQKQQMLKQNRSYTQTKFDLTDPASNFGYQAKEGSNFRSPNEILPPSCEGLKKSSQVQYSSIQMTRNNETQSNANRRCTGAFSKYYFSNDGFSIQNGQPAQQQVQSHYINSQNEGESDQERTSVDVNNSKTVKNDEIAVSYLERNMQMILNNLSTQKQNGNGKKTQQRWQSLLDYAAKIQTGQKEPSMSIHKQTVKTKFKVEQLLSSNQFSETYLVKVQDEPYLLKVIDKAKYIKKEWNPHILRMIPSLFHIEHPCISHSSHWYMSKDHFYFFNKFQPKKEDSQQPQHEKEGHHWSSQNTLFENSHRSEESKNQINNESKELKLQEASPLADTEILNRSHIPITLASFLQSRKDQLTLQHRAILAKDILLAVQYIHSKEIPHCNINPFNILITNTNLDSLEGCSADNTLNHFVFLTHFCQNGYITKKLVTGKSTSATNYSDNQLFKNNNQLFSYSQLCFMAPERIQGNLILENIEFCKRADTWSVGVVLYCLFSGKLPYEGCSYQDLYDQIKKTEVDFSGPEWESIPYSCINLIHSMLIKDPCNRVDSVSAIVHPFFQEVDEMTESVIMGDENHSAVRQTFSMVGLMENIHRYHTLLEMNTNTVKIFLVVFGIFANKIPDLDMENFQGYFDSAKDIILTQKVLQNGLTMIMGESTLAKWMTNQLMKEEVASPNNSTSNAQDSHTIPLQEVIVAYLNLHYKEAHLRLKSSVANLLELANGDQQDFTTVLNSCMSRALGIQLPLSYQDEDCTSFDHVVNLIFKNQKIQLQQNQE